MKALVTGAYGLIGTEACNQFAKAGYDVIGIDNDMRRYFFGEEASTAARASRVECSVLNKDIRDQAAMDDIIGGHKPDVIIHTAAQPSHDWAAREPHTDFGVNALGTLNLLEAVRNHCPDSTFIHCSTSKVYGAHPNDLPVEDVGTRFDLPEDHEYYDGITTTMSVDQTTHSLFGVSKLSADLLVQEYGRYFDIPTVCFRPGCLTGGYHAGTELHGFLSYLMRCAITGRPYIIYGYRGKQVRCNIHSEDLVSAFLEFARRPGVAEVYNIGGGRQNSISMNEAIRACEEISGNRIERSYGRLPRIGDHIWWISSNAAFEADYPLWQQKWTLGEMLWDIHNSNLDAWSAERQ